MGKGIKLSVIGIVCIFTILLSSLGLAQTQISSSVISNVVAPGQVAEFEITITNNAEDFQTYNLFSFTQGWSVDPSPLSDRIIENIAPGMSYTTQIRAVPQSGLTPGIYYVQVQIDGSLEETYSVPLKAYVRSETPLDYLPSIIVTVDMDDVIDPTEVQSILLHLENRNVLDLTGLEVEIQSEMPEFNVNRVIDLAPLEKKTLEFTIDPNPFSQPKEYYLFFVFRRDGETVKVLDQKIEIETNIPTFDLVSQKETIFLKTFQSLTVTNEGNVRNTQEILYPINIFSSLFVSSDDSTITKVDGKRYLSWEAELAPQETITLHVTYQYRVLLYMLLVLVAFLIFYYVVRSPISLRKGVVTTKSRDGSIAEIKIALDVRNVSKHPLKDVEVTEFLPGITNLHNDVDLGTLKPHAISSTKRGKKVVWKLAEVEALEHRIITYKIKPKLNVLGTLEFPRAFCTFKKGKGKKSKAYSNVFRLNLGKGQ